ncbi:hypothetical protein QO001_006467 [Methylobacterium brachiatum]|uniref:Uncharacterized protein n=1 Tax=Methylobacterium brachiatum TaxID=269660 RepID=A0AAJ1U1D1_9HYPH|nr:hypothetical protein [Methylobacterium brachiatum]MCB4806497.1 hypothetical protein [Methylobacterium brachiatum]MDQ0547508.1 hypothetical protein [Methylobacterium brachiatum]
MLFQPLDRSAPGLQRHDAVLALTGRQYRLAGDGLAVGVVLGMLDARTGRLPIGLVDAQNAYWAETLYYDANRRTIDVYDPDRWSAFVDTYAGGGWVLDIVSGLGRFALMVVGRGISFVMRGFALALVPAMLFGLFGLASYGFLGLIVYLVAAQWVQWLPHLIGGVIAWLGLCVVLSDEQTVRRVRVGRGLQTLNERQLMPVLG